jgi:hypothetical protein
MGENIMYNGRNPLGTLISLAVDDGVSSRGHRHNILKKGYVYTGIVSGKFNGASSGRCYLRYLNTMSVFVYSGSSTDKQLSSYWIDLLKTLPVPKGTTYRKYETCPTTTPN